MGNDDSNAYLRESMHILTIILNIDSICNENKRKYHWYDGSKPQSALFLT